LVIGYQSIVIGFVLPDSRDKMWDGRRLSVAAINGVQIPFPSRQVVRLAIFLKLDIWYQRKNPETE